MDICKCIQSTLTYLHELSGSVTRYHHRLLPSKKSSRQFLPAWLYRLWVVLHTALLVAALPRLWTWRRRWSDTKDISNPTDPIWNDLQMWFWIQLARIAFHVVFCCPSCRSLELRYNMDPFLKANKKPNHSQTFSSAPPRGLFACVQPKPAQIWRPTDGNNQASDPKLSSLACRFWIPEQISV